MEIIESFTYVCFQLGSSIVFVVSGTAPPDMAEIVLKLITKTPHKNLVETNIAKIDKDYFSSKFIVHFDEPGTSY